MKEHFDIDSQQNAKFINVGKIAQAKKTLFVVSMLMSALWELMR